MMTSQNPDELFLRAEQLRSRSAHETCERPAVQDHHHDRDIGRYPNIPFTICRDLKFSFDEIQGTMSAIYRKDISWNGKHKVSVCGNTVAAAMDRRTSFAATNRPYGQILGNKRRERGQGDPNSTPMTEEENTIGAEKD